MLRNIVNCKNCGAPLHFDDKKRLAICKYCDSEYHLDNLGMIEEYKVELDIMGRRMMFYINYISTDYDDCSIETVRLIDGSVIRYEKSFPKVTLELISYGDVL